MLDDLVNLIRGLGLRLVLSNLISSSMATHIFYSSSATVIEKPLILCYVVMLEWLPINLVPSFPPIFFRASSASLLFGLRAISTTEGVIRKVTGSKPTLFGYCLLPADIFDRSYASYC